MSNGPPCLTGRACGVLMPNLRPKTQPMGQFSYRAGPLSTAEIAGRAGTRPTEAISRERQRDGSGVLAMRRGAGVLKADRARPVVQLAAAHLIGEQCGPTSPAAAHPRARPREVAPTAVALAPSKIRPPPSCSSWRWCCALARGGTEEAVA
jgi:hypothetical protein